MVPTGVASLTGRHTHGVPHSFRIGRIAGIEIRVHVTFFLLVPLFALAGAAPGGSGALAGVAWLVVIFACVLVHEFAHCLVGRPRGAVVHEIELLPIGGVSKLEHLPEDPRDEFAMAIAGPAASLGIAIVAAVVALALSLPLLPVDFLGGSILVGLVWFNLPDRGVQPVARVPARWRSRAALAPRAPPRSRGRQRALPHESVAGSRWCSSWWGCSGMSGS